MSTGHTIARVTDADLKRLLKALHRGTLRTPITRAGLVEAAFGHVEEHLDVMVGRDRASAQALIVAVLQERSQRRTGGAELTLSGPAAPGSPSRDTRESVAELIAHAQQSVLLMGVRSAADRGLLATLEAIAEPRGLEVTLVGGDITAFEDGAALPERWRLYTPREFTVVGCAAVIDRCRALLTSDSLSGRETEARLHLGAVIEDEAYVARLLEELERLSRSGLLVAAR